MDQGGALIVAKDEGLALPVRNATFSGSLWEPFTQDEGSSSSSSGSAGSELQLNWSRGEEMRFVVAISVYGFACVLQIMMIVAARGTHVGRVSLGDATPLDRAIGRLQMLDATPRNFERAEHIELPDVAETEHKGFLVSFFLPAMKVLLVFGSVAVCIYFLPITSWVTSVLEYIRASGWVGYLILAACYIPAALTGFAISVLALSAGALYGPVDGTIVAVIGYNCGGLAGFLAGRYLVRDCVMDWIRTSRKALVALQLMGREGWLLVLVCRACPFVPYAPANYVFGLSDVGGLTFVVSSVVAATPYTFISVAVGATADDIVELHHTSPPRWMLVVVTLALIVFLATAFRLRSLGKKALAEADARKALRRRQQKHGTPCEPLSARQRTSVPLTTAFNGVVEQQDKATGASGGQVAGGSSSPWVREMNPLNLSIASAVSVEEETLELETSGGSSSDKGAQETRGNKMTRMEITTADRSFNKSSPSSMRLSTRDEDEDVVHSP